MTPYRSGWSWILALSCLAAWAPASQISIEIHPMIQARPGHLLVETSLRNQGDEPAHSLVLDTTVGSITLSSDAITRLDPNQSTRITNRFDTLPSPPGSHCLTLRATYTDINGYPFSAIRVIPFLAGTSAEPEMNLTLRLPTINLRTTDQFPVTIDWKGSGIVTASVRLVTSDALTVLPDTRLVQLETGVPATAHFTVRQISALPGSRYSMAGVVEWVDAAGSHHAASDTGIARLPHLRPPPIRLTPLRAWILAGILLAAWLTAQWRLCPLPRSTPFRELLLNLFLFAGIYLCLFTYIPIRDLMNPALAVGGDTPAHHYLAGHLKQQFFNHGNIVSWAPGWWCGFPMFQYYFPLPYLLMAALSSVIPYGIAFRWISILGILALPPAAYTLARIFDQPLSVRRLTAIGMVPFLFIHTHTMWGVNIYSTLAGMIANSVSFPVMLLFLASAFRDARDASFRLRTVWLAVGLVMSHFFTSLVGAMCAVCLAMLWPRTGIRRTLIVLVTEAALVFLLMAWWLIPLVAKQSFAMDFGINWKVDLWDSVPGFMRWLAPFGAGAAVWGLWRRNPFITLHTVMFVLAAILFRFGYTHLSPVFVNVRLWPFMAYAILVLEVAGLGWLIEQRRGKPLLLTALLVLAATVALDRPRDVTSWIRWNYANIQEVPRQEVFDRLIMPLADTPGRLAYDLHPDNHAFLGSTRVFEAVPFVAGKPILEGGLVNSAVGALYAYYVQGEMSRGCAGFPTIMKPPRFNPANGVRHLEWFNVTHFLARWESTRNALAVQPGWRRVDRVRRWTLFEATNRTSRFVTVPSRQPLAVSVAGDWKPAALEWLYTIQSLDVPCAILRRGDPSPTGITPLTEDAFKTLMADCRTRNTAPESSPIEPGAIITNEIVATDRIQFHTTGIGLPHLVKVSYFPNWKVRGADHVYLVAPGMMLVYPTGPDVELYYGSIPSDRIGRILTIIGWLIVIGLLIVRFRPIRHQTLTAHA